MRKAKRCLGVIWLVAFLMLIGTVGGIERDSIPLLDGFILSSVYLIIFGCTVAANNALDEMIARYKRRTPHQQEEGRAA